MTATALDKTFDPAAIEAKWYAYWEAGGLFRPERPEAQPFTIVNPPPNVTGSLHIGHALDNTLQDIVIRYERLRGKDALWVVGTDHAGIATQMVVERQMEERQDKRTNYSREAFIDKVWEWKAESGGTITRQLRRLGCSMDWSREQFTMDPHFTKAVVKVFVDLYNQGLIYRDKRLVNWDPKLRTAISDLEVETREVQGSFWHFRYPLEDGVTLPDGRDYIVVATTRPETMLADMAVAVNGEDERYKSVIGRHVKLPLTGRLVPIVADEHADPELGSGAVKITPGHDFNDFEVGKRAGFKPAEMLNMLDAEAKVVQTADGLIPADLVGLDRFDARKQVVAQLEGEGLLELVEDRTIQTPYGDRGGVVIEPWLTDQWYVDAATLAQPPLQAVRDGRIEIVPKTWEKTFFNWMENIQPWCVSRQLWWGHRIPAWYDTDGNIFVSEADDRRLSRQMAYARLDEGQSNTYSKHFETEAEAREFAAGTGWDFEPADDEGVRLEVSVGDLRGPRDGDPAPLRRVGVWRDPDVLDTWFSSALWPFATLGWPEESTQPPFGSSEVENPARGVSTSLDTNGLGNSGSLLNRHYPNDLLISGFDILFFWDARMAMQGMHFMGDVPWKRLYLHGLVRAADGQKMSKSKGNVVDPLGLIDRYGADALRFFMAAMESQGRDVKMDEKRVEGYRNFATKLWNAARFCQANEIGASQSVAAPETTSAVNRWIVGEVVETLAELDKAMAELRFDAAANAIYHFVWDQFCDWYIELIKPVLSPLPFRGGAGGGDCAGEDALADEDRPHPNPSPQGEGLVETRLVAGWVLDQILVMLHPFMPFVTEELWASMGDRQCELIVARWPAPEAAVDADAKREVEWLIKLVSEIRAARTEINVPPSARTHLMVLPTVRAAVSPTDRPPVPTALVERVDRNRMALNRLARLNNAIFLNTGVEIELGSGERLDRARSEDDTKKTMGPQIVVDDVTYILPIEGVIDVAAEKARLEKARAASEKERDSLAKRLENPSFVEKAKPEAVEKARADHAAHAAEAERLAAALARLG